MMDPILDLYLHVALHFILFCFALHFNSVCVRFNLQDVSGLDLF